jgi:hypothetical protein
MTLLRVGVGQSQDVREAVAVAMEKTDRPDLAIVFASSRLDPHQTYQAVKDAVGDCPIIGGTSAGEFSSAAEQPLEDSVAIMTLQSTYLSVGVGVGEHLAEHPDTCGAEAVRQACTRVEPNPVVVSLITIAMSRKDASDVSRIKPYLNVVLPDGSCGQEEAFLRAALTETGTVAQIVGGSTANDFNSDKTYQFGNGVFNNAGVVATLCSGLKMGTAMGHPYFPVGKGAVVTKADGRMLQELNGHPATDGMKALIGEPELNADVFAQNPVGIKSSDVFGQYTIKSAERANADGSIRFLAEMGVGSYLTRMKSEKNYAIASFKKTLERAIIDAGRPKKIGAIIIFNCILRHLLKCRLDINDLAIVREVAGDAPMIGFNTFGEQGVTAGGSLGHYNQTATMLVIGDELITQ